MAHSEHHGRGARWGSWLIFGYAAPPEQPVGASGGGAGGSGDGCTSSEAIACGGVQIIRKVCQEGSELRQSGGEAALTVQRGTAQAVSTSLGSSTSSGAAADTRFGCSISVTGAQDCEQAQLWSQAAQLWSRGGGAAAKGRRVDHERRTAKPCRQSSLGACPHVGTWRTIRAGWHLTSCLVPGGTIPVMNARIIPRSPAWDCGVLHMPNKEGFLHMPGGTWWPELSWVCPVWHL